MRATRRAAALVVLTSVALATATGCSRSGSDSSAATAAGPTTAAAPTTVAGPRTSSPSIDPNATTTIADLGDVAGPVGDCLKLAARFSNLVQGVLTGPEGAARSQQSALDMTSQLPARLHGAADVVATTFGKIAANGGKVDGAGIDTAAYQAAVTSFGDYFSHDCKS